MSNLNNLLNLDNSNINEYDNIINKSLKNENIKKLHTENNYVNNEELDLIDDDLNINFIKKSLKKKTKSYDLLLNSKDRKWFSSLDRNKKRFEFNVNFMMDNNSKKKIKKYIYENNIFNPYSEKYTINMAGFYYNNIYYFPWNPQKPKGNIIYNNDEYAHKYFDINIFGSENIQINKNFKDIKSIEIVNVILPNRTDSRIITANKYNEYPYILLNIEQINSNNYGSNSSIDNSFIALTCSTNNYNKNEHIKYTPLNNCKKEFLPPLSNLENLTISLKNPSGKNLSGEDNLKINCYTVTNILPEIDIEPNTGCNNTDKILKRGSLINYGYDKVYTPELYKKAVGPDGDYGWGGFKNNYIIKLQLNHYFNCDDYKIGDKIIINNFLPSIYASWDSLYQGYDISYNENNLEFQNFEKPYYQNEIISFTEFINRKEGHKILFTDNCPKPKWKYEKKKNLNTNKEYESIIQVNWNPDSPWININNNISDYYSNKEYNESIINELNNSLKFHNTIYIEGPINYLKLKNENIIECKNWFEKLIKCDLNGKKCLNFWDKKLYPILLFDRYWTTLSLPVTIKSNKKIYTCNFVKQPTIKFLQLKNYKHYSLITPQMFYIYFFQYYSELLVNNFYENNQKNMN